jgi:hypothetical protein
MLTAKFGETRGKCPMYKFGGKYVARVVQGGEAALVKPVRNHAVASGV